MIEFPRSQRERLGRLFEEEKLRRDPLASKEDLAKARDHATHAPVMLGFVVRPQRNVIVPVHEQWLAAGAALGHLLLAAHDMHFGAIILSGDRCADALLREALGVVATETLAGFISIGTIARNPPAAVSGPVASVLSAWTPAEARARGTAPRRS